MSIPCIRPQRTEAARHAPTRATRARRAAGALTAACVAALLRLADARRERGALVRERRSPPASTRGGANARERRGLLLPGGDLASRLTTSRTMPRCRSSRRDDRSTAPPRHARLACGGVRDAVAADLTCAAIRSSCARSAREDQGCRGGRRSWPSRTNATSGPSVMKLGTRPWANERRGTGRAGPGERLVGDRAIERPEPGARRDELTLGT